MKVLVTGAGGFIGKNLTARLELLKNVEILCFEKDTPAEILETYCAECSLVFHLAGVNRPEHMEEYMEGNAGFTENLTETLRRHKNCCPLIYASSIQAASDNPYGRSKKAGEELLAAYGEQSGAPVIIYRLPNIFGKWCRPDYNSAVATFCHHIAHGLPIQVHDRKTRLHLVYIDDVVEELLQAMEGHPHRNAEGQGIVPLVYEETLGRIVDLLTDFQKGRRDLMLPDLTEGSFEKKLYSTYLSYLPEDAFAYPLEMHEDERGSFTEILKSTDRGQVSVNIARPGVTKGNHWHHTKTEKFVVVSGRGVIRFRRPGSSRVKEYHVSGNHLEVVDIPPGYVHAIENVGDTELVTLMWCNECFDPDNPDTISETAGYGDQSEDGKQEKKG